MLLLFVHVYLSCFRHNQISDLHRQNLASWRQKQQLLAAEHPLQYRDRAKERRQKYGKEDNDGPKPNRLKEKYLKAVEEADSKSVPERNIDSSNIGNKMLQKMGWKEGLGLGKSNQGRTSIIEVS